MSNCMFGFPIYSDVGVTYTPALSGGSWLAALPLTNMQDRRLGKVARSTNATAAFTQFDIDLGVARAVSLLAVLIPNLTKSAVPTIQWKGGTSLGASDVYDSTALAAWPTGVTAEDAAGLNVWIPTIPATAKTARYWRCLIVDTANVDGYLNVARVAIMGGYTPTLNLNNGAKTTLEDDTTALTMDGGAKVYNVKRIRRGDQFQISDLSNTEVFANVRKMQRILGKSGQLFFVFNPADTALMYERAYLCVMRELDALEYPYGTDMNVGYNLVEEL